MRFWASSVTIPKPRGERATRMDREQLIAQIGKLVAERQRIDAELDRILGLVGKWSLSVAPRRGRPPGVRTTGRATAGARKPRATRKKRGLQKGSLAFRIVAAVQKNGKPMKAREVATALGEKRVPPVASTMHKLGRGGHLRRVGRGRYGAPR